MIKFNKFFISFTFLITFNIIVLAGISEANFDKFYGGLSYRDSYPTTDGGIIIATKNRLSENENGVSTLIKLSHDGSTEWTKGIEGFLYAKEHIIQLQDGTFIVGGSDRMLQNYSLEGDLKLLHLDQKGNIIWSKNFDSGAADELWELKSTSDGGCIILSGRTYFPMWVNARLSKIDSSGTLLWQKQFSGETYDYISSIAETPDGSLLLSRKNTIIKFSSDGTLNWTNAYDVSDTNILSTADNKVLLYGGGYSSSTESKRYLVKTDENGTVLWEKEYAIFKGYYSGLYHGAISTNSSGEEDGYILTGSIGTLKIDLDGNKVWQKPYMANSIRKLASGNFILESYSNNRESNVNTYLFSITPDGNLLGCDNTSGIMTEIFERTLPTGTPSDIIANISDANFLTIYPSDNIEHASMFVESNACNAGKTTYDVYPNNINFGSIELGKSGTGSFSVSNTDSEDLGIPFLANSYPNEIQYTNNCPKILHSGETCSVDVAFSPSNLGYRATAISILTTSTLTPSTYVSFTGYGLPRDSDNDGYPETTDCNDFDATINPGAVEIPYNNIDENCNGMIDEDDIDNDGYLLVDDCNDNNAAINPGKAETPYNGIDENCNGMADDDDLDGDGFGIIADCNDNDATINPSKVEISYNGVDENCNGMSDDDDLDNDGYLLIDDCNDNNAGISPGAYEIFNNGIDENCNGMTDDTQADVIVDSLADEVQTIPLDVLMPPIDSTTNTTSATEVATNRFTALQNMVNGVSDSLATINDTMTDPEKLVIFNDALLSLNDILVKTDGFYGGNPANDWVTTQEGQDILYPSISNTIAFVQGEIDKLSP